MAEERGETKVGFDSRQKTVVGYEIRFDSQKPRDRAGITFCTPGIVHLRLRSDPMLRDISHIILDEVHERDLHTDVLLGVLKMMHAESSHLKIIIMSASLDEEKFVQYLGNCPVVQVEGRMHKAQWIVLPTYLFLRDVRYSAIFA